MSFDIALSGLNAVSRDLEVISNNIANSATTGFKSSRTEFFDLYSATSKDSSGQGVTVSNVRQDFKPGNFTDTDRSLDLAIDGEGFFRVEKEGVVSYTRNGIFSVDRGGYLVNASGHHLTGYETDVNGGLNPTMSRLRLNPGDLDPQQTTEIQFGINLDATKEVLPAFDVNDPDTYNSSTATTIYDSLGNPNVLTLYFHKDTPNTWTMFSYVDGLEVNQPGGDELIFDTDGNLNQINGVASNALTIPPYAPPTGGATMSVDFELTGLTQYSGNFGVNQLIQDGYSNGRLTSLNVTEEGELLGRYSNGQTETMGMVTLTNFQNVDGLQQILGTSWTETFESGAALTGEPGSASLGIIRAGSVEASNVDLTKELVSMISAQRNFQANAQVITTHDTINQTVINMRR